MKDTLNSLSIEEKVGQLFTIGIAGPEIDEQTQGLLSEISPGGVCLFTRNIREAEQTRKLLDDLRQLSRSTPMLSVDQEGGLVDRLRRIMTPLPAANRLRTPDDARRMGAIIAETLRILGFNVDFAPVVDVIDQQRSEQSNGLYSREFGRSKENVVDLAGTFLKELQRGGIAGCLKHFPGLGAAKVDSHEELPQVSVSRDELYAVDLYPYRELIKAGGVNAVMVAHAAFPDVNLQEIDQDGKLLPSSLSYNFITKLLRDELGFNGLVITDDLEMGAIIKNYGIGEACKMAIKAGADMLAICADPDRIREGFHAVISAVKAGEISNTRLDESLGRIAALKSELADPFDFDIERLARLSSQIQDLNGHLSTN